MLGSTWNVWKSCPCHRLRSSTRSIIGATDGHLEVANALGWLENILGTLAVVLTPPGSHTLGII